MNIAMEQTEEFLEGQLKAKYGDCFIRGNNGKLIMYRYDSICIFSIPYCCIHQCYTFQLKRNNGNLKMHCCFP
jgi:hypothetical protein